ncbi:MAG TPA: AAA family ATPase [Anaerolineales bacterium]|nr:AAA family ATPase [Anaerolineales bacterium]
MPVSLLTAKIHLPLARANVVSRGRLSSRLLDGMEQPASIALISAPAGFGKTTLLGEFAAQCPAPVAWLSLDDNDNDPIQFWTYVIAACQAVQAHLGDAALALLQAPQALRDETIPTLLINDLAKLPRRLLLVLDDYHAIQNASVHAGLAFLLEHMPAQTGLVISTRVDPPLPLARLRVRPGWVEIRALDLRFTTDETGVFLNQSMGLNLSESDVAALEARTEGWIASLQLAAISMKDRSDVSGFIRAFTGSHAYVAEYLAEEVLQRQPVAVRDFLLRTSILERMNASLCEAVSGEGSSRVESVSTQGG